MNAKERKAMAQLSGAMRSLAADMQQTAGKAVRIGTQPQPSTSVINDLQRLIKALHQTIDMVPRPVPREQRAAFYNAGSLVAEMERKYGID